MSDTLTATLPTARRLGADVFFAGGIVLMLTILLPGGQINPDLLRVEPKALQFIKDIFDAKKVVAAVCHAPWLLIETGIAKGRKMTSFKSIKTDVANAGAKWEDSEVVVDQGVITSRNPGDLEAFSAKIIEEVKEGRHSQRSAA